MDAGAQTVAGFLTGVGPGAANEGSQLLSLVVTNDNAGLFAVAPAIDLGTGVLTYTPAAAATGRATVTVTLSDDGGTANGGVDTTVATFDISVGGFQITKTADVGTGDRLPGTDIVYTVTVTNDDAVTYAGVEVSDATPAGTSWVETWVTLPVTRTVADLFGVVSYANNDGTVNWVGTWTETGDDGTPSGGDIRVQDDPGSGTRLILDLVGPNNSVERTVNLAAATSAMLSFDYVPYDVNNDGEEVYLDIWDGSSWTRLHTFAQIERVTSYSSWSGDISAYMNAGTKIRFSTANGLDDEDGLGVDDLVITYTTAGTPVAGDAGPVHASGVNMAPGDEIVVTYEVTIDDPATVCSIANTATATTGALSVQAVTNNGLQNRAPVVEAGGNQAIAEGGSVSLDPATFVDGDCFEVNTATIDWGDGNITAGTVDQVLDTVAGSHTYADDGTYTVIVTVSDDDGASGVDNFTVTVSNVAPTIALAGDASVDEGATYTLTLGAVTDPGDDTVTSWIVDWGDGDTNTYGSAGDVTHTYADGANSYTIAVDLVDEDGTHTDAGSHAVSVTNVAPAIALAGDASVAEGSVFTLTLGAITDPGDDTVSQIVIDWGDGSPATTVPGTTTSVGHTYADGPNGYTITVDLVDEDDTHTDAGSRAVSVTNVAPTIALAGDASVAEGSTYTLTLGAISDPGDDTVTDWIVDWGDGTIESLLAAGDVTHV